MAEPTLSDVMTRLDQLDERLDERLGSIWHELRGIENRLTAVEQAVIKLVAASPVPV